MTLTPNEIDQIYKDGGRLTLREVMALSDHRIKGILRAALEKEQP